MICFVVYESADLKTPECLKEFSILEMLVNRWVPGNDSCDKKTKSSQIRTSDCIDQFYDDD